MSFSKEKPNSKAIIVAAYGGDILHSEAIKKNAEQAYTALDWQGYDPTESIYYLAPESVDIYNDGQEDRDAGTSLAALQYAINNWAADADDLVVYMIGHGSFDTFKINGDGEILDADTFAGWLNDLQAVIPGRVVVVYDACFSGSFIEPFTVPNNTDFSRVAITSSTANQDSMLHNNGEDSFSYSFWQSYYHGADIFQAYTKGLNMMSTIQQPRLDTNGDGIANGDLDYIHMAGRRLGRGIITDSGASLARIAAIPGTQLLIDDDSSTLWLELESNIQITDVSALIIPPDYTAATSEAAENEIITVPLIFSQTNNRYEAEYTGFTLQGTYTISYQVTGERDGSAIRWQQTARIIRSFTGPDQYEDDDQPSSATPVIINRQLAQHHTIHAPGDSDWGKFFGKIGKSYDIEVTNQGPDMITKIDLYQGDDINTPVASKLAINNMPDPVVMTWDCLLDGVYYIRVSHQDPLVSGPGTIYDLRIVTPSLTDFPPFSPLNGTISSNNIALDNTAILAVGTSNSKVYTTEGISAGDGCFNLDLPAGLYNLTFNKTGYQPTTATNIAIPTDTPLSINLLSEPAIIPGDLNGDKTVDLGDEILILQALIGGALQEPFNLDNDINDNGKADLGEAIFILQKLSETN